MAQSVKNLPAVLETRVRPLGWEDPLEKKVATHSSILAWKIPWTEDPVRLQPMGSQRVGHDWATNTLTVHSLILDMFCKETNTLSYSDTSRTLLSSRHSLPEEFFFLMAKKLQC